MKTIFMLALAAVILGGCNPHAADGGGAGEPASAPAAAPGFDFSGDFDLRGTEPFWALTIRADALALTRVDGDPFNAPNAGPQVEGDTALWDGGPLHVTLRRETCSDGMSDRVYAFAATVEVKDTVMLKGCGERPRPPGTSTE
jgi:uncharacterized membrane protein